MRRLLFLCEYGTLLGGERSMLATLPAVAAASFDITVAAPSGGEFEAALRQQGFEHFDLESSGESKDRLPRMREAIEALAARVRPSIIHANSLAMARVAGPVAERCGVPSVGHLRDILKVSRQAARDLNAHQSLIAVSHATRDFHVGQGIDEAKCVVAYNGVDLDEFCPRAATGYLANELGLPTKSPLVAVIGQLGLRKGTDVALCAATLAAAKLPDVHWLIVGERTSAKLESLAFESELHARAQESPLAGRVHFLGQRADMPRLLNECKALVHTARQEPLGRVLLESAASGLPVIATDVGGTREVFPSEADGALLVAADDAVATAKAVVTLLGDENRRIVLAACGRRRAEQQFAIRDAAARMLEIYETVLS